MDRIALVNQVKSKIDELSPDDAILVEVGIEDNNPIDTIIESLLDESAKEVLLKAPIHRLSITSSPVTATADTTNDYTGTVEVPSNFLRLVEFRMKEWKRSVVEFCSQDSDIAMRQSNKWLRAKASKPVAILSHRSVSSGDPLVVSTPLVIEYYSVVDDHTIDRFLYIKSDVAENIPIILQDTLCWICASKVLTVFGKVVEAKAAIDNAVDLMQ